MKLIQVGSDVFVAPETVDSLTPYRASQMAPSLGLPDGSLLFCCSGQPGNHILVSDWEPAKVIDVLRAATGEAAMTKAAGEEKVQ